MSKGNSWKVQVVMPDDWRAALESAARDADMQLSEFIRDAIRRRVPSDVRKRLTPVRVGRRPADE